jgi:hypothetical protein
MATITLYDHTAQRFASGANVVADTYKINLYTAFTFTAADTTKAAAETGATQVATANGYTQDTKALANVAIAVATTNDATFDADNVTWNASGGSITASYALIYNDTDADDPPVAYIDFEGSQSAGDGTAFLVTWNASGIFSFVVA